MKKIETLSKNLNIQNVAEYEDALAQLKEITDIEIKGQILRSKCEEKCGEKSSKYFLNLEKFRYKQKTIGKLKKPDGSFETSTKGILGQCKDFYENLFNCCFKTHTHRSIFN